MGRQNDIHHLRKVEAHGPGDLVRVAGWPAGEGTVWGAGQSRRDSPPVAEALTLERFPCVLEQSPNDWASDFQALRRSEAAQQTQSS